MKDVKIFARTIEPDAKKQIQKMADSEAYRDCKIRIMPDCHAGKGCTIGTVIETRGKVVPNTVGVDIGCGMHVVDLGFANIDMALLDRIINDNIPSGFNVHERPLVSDMVTVCTAKSRRGFLHGYDASTSIMSCVRSALLAVATTLSRLTWMTKDASIS